MNATQEITLSVGSRLLPPLASADLDAFWEAEVSLVQVASDPLVAVLYAGRRLHGAVLRALAEE
jgi:hypothetical protein